MEKCKTCNGSGRVVVVPVDENDRVQVTDLAIRVDCPACNGTGNEQERKLDKPVRTGNLRK